MTLVEFFGSLFLGFAPIVCFFLIFLLKDSQLVIISLTGMFFSCISALIASIFWKIIPFFQDIAWWNLIFGAIFQDSIRILFFYLYKRVRRHIFEFPEQKSPPNILSAGLAFGVGNAISYGLIFFVAPLFNILGPASAFSSKCPPVPLFLLLSIENLCYSSLQIILCTIFFELLSQNKSILYFFVTFGFHLLCSFMSIIPNCFASIALSYVVLFIFILYGLLIIDPRHYKIK